MSRCQFIALVLSMLAVLQTAGDSGDVLAHTKAEADFEKLKQTPTYNAIVPRSLSIREDMLYDAYSNYVFSMATGRIGVWYETRYGSRLQADLDACRAAGIFNGAIAEGMDWFEGGTDEQKAAYMAKALEEADGRFLEFLAEVKVEVDSRQWNN